MWLQKLLRHSVDTITSFGVRTVAFAAPVAVSSVLVYHNVPSEIVEQHPAEPIQLERQYSPSSPAETVDKNQVPIYQQAQVASVAETTNSSEPKDASPTESSGSGGSYSHYSAQSGSTPGQRNAFIPNQFRPASVRPSKPIPEEIQGTEANTFFSNVVEEFSSAVADGPATTPSANSAGSNPASVTTPEVTLVSGPNTLSNQTSATFTFTLIPASTTAKCALDDAEETDCTSPITLSALADGAHTFVITPNSLGATGSSLTTAWTVDTVAPNAPAPTLTSSSPTNTAIATLTLADCSDTSEVLVNEAAQPAASDSGWQTCSTAASAITYTLVTDGVRTLNVWAKDSSDNISATSGSVSVTYDSTAPSVALTSLTGGQKIAGGSSQSINWTATDTNLGATPISLAYSTNGGTSWTSIATGEANDGTYNWSVPVLNSATIKVRVAAVDDVSNSATSASTSNFTIDSTAPTITAGQMSLNGGAGTAANNYIQVSLQGTDSLSKITHFCLRYNSMVDPTAVDPCWTAVNATPPGLVAATTLSLSNFTFQIGFSSGAYTIYAWLKDETGNISSLTAAGAGTAAQDKSSITYIPGTPPVVTNILATNTDLPSDPPTSGELGAAIGNDVVIKWTASDDNALPATPVNLYYTTDDVTYTLIAANLTNAQNGACTVNNPGTTADDLATGCYLWTGGSPTSNYFKVRVTVTDSNAMTSASPSTALNTWPPINFLAGNTDPGLGSSSSAAIFFSHDAGAALSDPGSLVVASNGVIYFRDAVRGILKVDPANGNQTLYIPKTGTASGDGGPVTSATLRQPNRIALDSQDRLLILDWDRIRRVESDGTIDTLIGGGVSTADGASPLDVQISPLGMSGWGNAWASFFVLPNGNIYFANYGAGYRIRVYDADTNQVNSIYLSGSEDSAGTVGFDLSLCAAGLFGAVYDPATSVLSYASVITNHSSTLPGCDNTGWRFAQVNPVTGATVVGGPHPPSSHHYVYARVQAKTGELYSVSRANGYISKFNPATNLWTAVVGNGVVGTCPDGTAATSCAMEPMDVYINAQGKLYFVDRGRIRTLDENGNVLTLAGQSLDFGDGGNPLSARFGTINSLDMWDDAGTNKIIILDRVSLKFREFTIGGTIDTIGGNGVQGAPANGSAAVADKALISSSGVYWDFFVTDTLGNVYYNRGVDDIAKIDRATGNWTGVVGGALGGTTFYYDPAADGLTGAQIRMGTQYLPVVLGFDGTNILAAKSSWNGSTLVESFYKLYATADGTQTHLGGVAGAGVSAGYCSPADGTVALTACKVPGAYYTINNSRASYDSFAGRWVTTVALTNKIYSLTVGGNLDTIVTLPRNILSFAYRHDAGNNIVYYCDSSGNKLYKYNITTSTETALSWPISSMGCTGRAMLYNAGRNSLIFPYTQSGLYGVAEYVNP